MAALGLLLGCSSTPEGGGPTAAELETMAEKAVTTLLETQPRLQETVDKAVGYVVLDMQVVKIPMIGTGVGYGVVIDKQSNTRSYIEVARFEVGGGYGAQRFKVIILFDDGELLSRVASGTWHYDAGAEVAAGSASADGGTKTSGKGYQAFKLADSGAVATVTVRIARAKPYLR
jgi:lipid-binding SYLF domain-containing protein